jgi:RimJ/RimL family protein N-acetyltransferase
MISLQEIKQEYLEAIKEARNKHYRFFRQNRLLTMADQNKWWFNNFNNDYMFAIIENSKLIGICGLTYIDWQAKKTDLSIYFFEDYININKGIIVLDILFKYAFENLGLNCIFSDLYDFDIKKQEFYEKYGFSKDGIFRQRYWRENRFIDSVLYTFIKDDYNKRMKII